MLPRGKECKLMGKLVPICYICEEVPTTGIANGMMLFKQFLCESCQDKIMTVTSDDKEYHYILNKIRELWETQPQVKQRMMYY